MNNTTAASYVDAYAIAAAYLESLIGQLERSLELPEEDMTRHARVGLEIALENARAGLLRARSARPVSG